MSPAPPKEYPNAVEALYQAPQGGKAGKVKCLLCPHKCVIAQGKTGICRVKKNVGGKLWAIAYGQTTSFSFDPIEKKPLYHFYPGTSILSIGPNSCNLKCPFCQNYQVSQLDTPTRYFSPQEIARRADVENCCGVSYTYSEPLMWYEYVLDCAKAVRQKGLKNVLVTNGMLEPEPFDEILPYIDGLNIDLKSMDEDFYKKTAKGKLAPVLRNIEKTAKGNLAHLEITNLVIPSLNDTDEDFQKLTDFLAGIDPEIPVHFSRYHPAYKMDYPKTPVETLLRAAEIARGKMKYVYIGNVYAGDYLNTVCPSCGAMLIERESYSGKLLGFSDGRCLECGEKVNIIGG